MTSCVIDVGGGESTLVDDLLIDGYRDITVLDISKKALEVARQRLGAAADQVNWVAADITEAGVLHQSYDVWHDRAVFHFLTRAEQRLAYVRNVIRSVKRGGHVIVSTFGPEGPTKCSGLDVVRYDSESLHDQFGAEFRLVEHATELHKTPSGATQQFLYCYSGEQIPPGRLRKAIRAKRWYQSTYCWTALPVRPLSQIPSSLHLGNLQIAYFTPNSLQPGFVFLAVYGSITSKTS